MSATRFLIASMLVALIGGCTDDLREPLGPSMDAPLTPPAAAATAELVVLTRNLYVGADVDAVIGALVTPDPADDLPALLGAVNTLAATDWPARAAAIAGEIARARPHVVGLQEVSTIDLTLPPFEIDVHHDFLPILMAELSARGLDYTVAARVRNIEATPLPGVRLLDEDALLVDRERAAVEATAARRFTTNLGPVAPGVVLERGWVSATLGIGQHEVLVASTHLESGAAPGLDMLRAVQATELIQALAAAPRAVIMGDLNDVPGSPMHQVFEAAGYTDVWAALRPGTRGYTCCHTPDLSNQVADFDERIDYVLARGLDSEQRTVSGRISIIGEVPADRFPGPGHALWPSDHGGLVAELRIPESNAPLP